MNLRTLIVILREPCASLSMALWHSRWKVAASRWKRPRLQTRRGGLPRFVLHVRLIKCDQLNCAVGQSVGMTCWQMQVERQGDMATCLQGRVATWQPPAGVGAADCTECPRTVATAVDFVATLGGDGTLLWACKTMGTEPVPPIVPFAMGSLGFMTPFSSKSLPCVMEVRRIP